MTILSKREKNMGDVEMDHLGRWSRVTLKGGKETRVVYTTYVPSDVDLGGQSTIQRKLQQEIDKEGEQIHWKQRLYDDMMEEISRDIGHGWELILGGGFNVTMEKGKMIKDKLNELGLKKILCEKLKKILPTRESGRYAIDHMWCTKGVERTVVKCGIVPRDGVFMSDHLDLFIDIRLERCRRW